MKTVKSLAAISSSCFSLYGVVMPGQTDTVGVRGSNPRVPTREEARLASISEDSTTESPLNRGFSIYD